MLLNDLKRMTRIKAFKYGHQLLENNQSRISVWIKRTSCHKMKVLLIFWLACACSSQYPQVTEAGNSNTNGKHEEKLMIYCYKLSKWWKARVKMIECEGT